MTARPALGVLLAGLSGTEVPTWLARRLDDGLCGVVLFAENTPDVATTRRLTDTLRVHHDEVVVAVDEEGGDVTRLQSTTGSLLPGAAAFGAVDDPDQTRRCAQLLGGVLAQAGIDLDLAPVLDVASEPDNPVIGVRAFGADPQVVARHGRAYAAGLAAAGVASCGKHYPGHGATRADTHLGTAVVDGPADLIAARDLPPFVASGVDAVMTAHVVVPAFGPEPASLSRWATERLRGDGFSGPIITDALGMGAITDRMPLGEACVRALEAGADLLCLDSPRHRDPEQALAEAVAAIEQGLVDGRLSAMALADSAERNRVLHRTPAAFDPEVVRRHEHRLAAAGLEVARRALTCQGDPRLPSAPLVVDLRRRQNQAAGRTSPVLIDEIRRRWPAAEVHTGPIMTGHDRPVLVLTREPRHDSAEGRDLAELLAWRPDAVVVHTGVAAAAPAVAHLVCTHGVGRPNALVAVEVLGR